MGVITNMLRARSIALALCAAAGCTAFAQTNNPSVDANVDDQPTAAQRRPLVPYNQYPLTLAPEDFDKAHLTPGTLLTMDVSGIPEFSGVTLRVDTHGDVSVPTLGNVHLGDVSVPEAQSVIAKALVASEILVSPVVRLSVAQIAPEYVSVLGEVQNPGRYMLIAKRSLADVLGLAGGATVAAGDDIEIQHAAKEGQASVTHVHESARGAAAKLQEVSVSPGDLVTVHRSGVVYVLGAVGRPGGYLMTDSGKLDIYQALSLAGGTSLDAARNGMYIIRPHDEVFETIRVPFSKLASKRQTEVQLRKDDVLYVPRSNWKVTLLDGSAIIGSALNAAIYNVK